jgi:hypothetical protein
MGFLSGISAALALAAAVFAGPHDQTTTNADGIRSIPVSYLYYSGSTRQDADFVIIAANTYARFGSYTLAIW